MDIETLHKIIKYRFNFINNIEIVETLEVLKYLDVDNKPDALNDNVILAITNERLRDDTINVIIGILNSLVASEITIMKKNMTELLSTVSDNSVHNTCPDKVIDAIKSKLQHISNDILVNSTRMKLITMKISERIYAIDKLAYVEHMGRMVDKMIWLPKEIAILNTMADRIRMLDTNSGDERILKIFSELTGRYMVIYTYVEEDDTASYTISNISNYIKSADNLITVIHDKSKLLIDPEDINLISTLPDRISKETDAMKLTALLNLYDVSMIMLNNILSISIGIGETISNLNDQLNID